MFSSREPNFVLDDFWEEDGLSRLGQPRGLRQLGNVAR